MQFAPRGFGLILVAAIAGCGQGFGSGSGAKVTSPAATGDLFAGPALWDDPQNTPHPMFNWPTLSHPPVGPNVPALWKPPAARALPANISALRHVSRAEEVPSGGGMAAFGSLAVVPGLGSASSVVDISDPLQPKRIGTFGAGDADDSEYYANAPIIGAPAHFAMEAAGAGADRGAAIIAYPSGRLVTVFSTDTVIESWDITNPEEPRRLRPLVTPNSHKVGVVPGTPIVYNAGSRGGGSAGNFYGSDHTEIFDLSDPDDPQFVQDFQNGYSCHHIFFWNNPEQNKFRAVCAGIEVTQIWDTADPRDPKVLVTIPVHHGVVGTPSAAALPVAFSHSAGLNRAGTVLYVGDENGGGGIPPGCVASASTPAGDPSTPIGAIWFYDISDETFPLLRGWYSAANNPLVKDPFSSCTAHHGRLVPDPERDLLAMAFYGDGVVLLDFTNPTLPRAIGQFADGSNTWEAWYHQGYIVTGDLSRGLDVLTFE